MILRCNAGWSVSCDLMKSNLGGMEMRLYTRPSATSLLAHVTNDSAAASAIG